MAAERLLAGELADSGHVDSIAPVTRFGHRGGLVGRAIIAANAFRVAKGTRLGCYAHATTS